MCWYYASFVWFDLIFTCLSFSITIRLKEEMRTLRDQVQESSDLNKTLKLELSVYEKLENTENQGENT